MALNSDFHDSVDITDMDWRADPSGFYTLSDSDSDSSGAATPTGPAPASNHINVPIQATKIQQDPEPEPEPESQPYSPIQPPRENFLDDAISRLLRNQPDRDPTSSGSEQREAADVAALDSLETTYATGDTLVLVDFPEAKQPYIKCNGRHWRATSFRVPSAALLGTGSTYFAKLYSPRAQARVRKHVDLAKFGEGIEYVLDLTPSLEGDDAAAQLIELSIPEGVRNWWLSMTRLGVSRFLVSGHDDHCPSHIDVPIEYESTEVLNKRDENLPRDNLDHIVMSQLRMVPDYCPVRHRANIIRLIRTILGEDLVLNSAIRVYTICGIAKQFDCASVIVSLP